MASSKKTDNYQLNEWVGSDRPHRIDFVNDNLILDKIIKQYKDLIDSQGIDARNAKKHIESMIHALNQLIADMDKKVPTSEEKAQFQRNALDISNIQQTLAETKAAVDNYTNTNEMMYEFFRKLKEDLRIANVEYFDDDKIIKLHKMDGSIEDINIDNRIINPDKFKAALQVAMQELLKLKEDERLIWTNKELNKKIDDKVKEATRPDIITDDTYTTHTINELLALIRANSKNIEYFETTGDNLGLVKWNKIIELLSDKFTRDNIVAELNKKESTVKDLNLEKDIKNIILNYVLEAIATAEQKNPKTPDDIHKNYDIDDGGKDVQPNKWNKYQILQIITDNINNLLNTYLPTAAEEVKGIITEKRVKELATNVATTLITALGNVVTFSALENWYNTNKYTSIDENTPDKLGVTTYKYIKSMIDKYAPELAEQDKAGLIKLSTIDDKISDSKDKIMEAVDTKIAGVNTAIDNAIKQSKADMPDTIYMYTAEKYEKPSTDKDRNILAIGNSKTLTRDGYTRKEMSVRELFESCDGAMNNNEWYKKYISDQYHHIYDNIYTDYLSTNPIWKNFEKYDYVWNELNLDTNTTDGYTRNKHIMTGYLTDEHYKYSYYLGHDRMKEWLPYGGEDRRGTVSVNEIYSLAMLAMSQHLPMWRLDPEDLSNTFAYGFVNKALIYNIVDKQLSTFTPANNTTLKNILDEYNTTITNIGTNYTKLEDKHNALDKTVKDLSAKVIKNEDFTTKEITGHTAAINGLIDTVNLHTTDISSLASSKMDKLDFANYQVEADSKVDNKVQTLKTDLETKINKNLIDTTDKYNSIDQAVKSQATDISNLDKKIDTVDKNKVNASDFNTYKENTDKKISDVNQSITDAKSSLDKKITDSINEAKTEINNNITTINQTIETNQNNSKDTLYVEYKDDNDKTYPKIVLDKSTETKSSTEGVTRQPLSSVRDIFNSKSLQINIPADDKNDKLSTLIKNGIVNVFETGITTNGSDVGSLKPETQIDAYLSDSLYMPYYDSTPDKGIVSLDDLWRVSYRASWNVVNTLLLNNSVTPKFPNAYGLISKNIVNKLIDQKLLDNKIIVKPNSGTEDTSVFGKINAINDEIATLKNTDSTIKSDLQEVTNKATINSNEIKRVENEYNAFKTNIGKTINDTMTSEITTMKESITTNSSKIKDLCDNKLDKSVFDTYKNTAKEELNTKFTTELKPINDKIANIDTSVKANTNHIINNAKLTGNTLVLTKADNSTIEVDLTHFVDSFTLPSDLFKNVTLNANKLVFTKQDGTNLEVDLSKFIDQVPTATETVSGTVTTKQIADQISTALAPVVQNLNEVSKNNVTEMKSNVEKLQNGIKELETKLNSLKSADGFTDEDIENLKKRLNIIKEGSTSDKTSIEDRLHALKDFKDNLKYTLLNNKYKEKYEPLLKLFNRLLAYMKNTIVNMPILKMTPKEGNKAPRVIAGENDIKLFEDLDISKVVETSLPELNKDNYVQVNKYLDDLIVKYRKYDIAFMNIIKKLSEEYFINYRDLGIKYYRDLKNLKDGSIVNIGYPGNKEFKHLVYIKPKENESLDNKIKPLGYILGNSKAGQAKIAEPDKVSMFTQYIDRYKSKFNVKDHNYLNYFEVYSKFGFKEDPFNSAIFNFYNNLDADKLSVLQYDNNKLSFDLMQSKYDKYYNALRNFYTNFAYYITSKTLLLKDKSLWLDQAKLNIPANMQPDTTKDAYIMNIDQYYRINVSFKYKKTDNGDYNPDDISQPGSMKDPTDANVDIAFDGNGITTTFGDWYYNEDPDGDIYDKVAEVFNLKDVIKYYDFVIKQYYEEGVINRSDELWNLFGKLYSIPSKEKKDQLANNIDMDNIDDEDDSYAHDIIDEVFSNGFLTSQNDLGFSSEQWKKTFDSSKLHTHQDVEQLIEGYKKEFSNPHFDFFRSDLGLFLYPGMILTLARVGLLGPELQHELMTDYPTFTGGNYLTKSERDRLLAKVPEEDIEEYYNDDGDIFNEKTVKFRYDFKSDKFIDSKSPIDDPSVQDFIIKCRNTFLDKAKEILLLVVDLKDQCKVATNTYKEAITQYSTEFKTVMNNENKDIFNFRKFTKKYKPIKATSEEETRDERDRIYDVYIDQEIADGKVIELDTVSIYRDSLFGTVDSKDLQTMIELVKDPAMDNMKSLTYDDVNSTLIYTKGMDEYKVDISPLTSRIPTDYVTQITYDKDKGDLHYLLYNGKDIVIELSKIFKYPKATWSTEGVISLSDIANSQTIKDLISKVDKQASAIDQLNGVAKRLDALEGNVNQTYVTDVTLKPTVPENVTDTDNVLDDKFYKVNINVNTNIITKNDAGINTVTGVKQHTVGLDNLKPLIGILDKKIKATSNNTKIPDNIEERIKKLEEFDKNIDINLISNKLKLYVNDLPKSITPGLKLLKEIITTMPLMKMKTKPGVKSVRETAGEDNVKLFEDLVLPYDPKVPELTKDNIDEVSTALDNMTISIYKYYKTFMDIINNITKEYFIKYEYRRSIDFDKIPNYEKVFNYKCLKNLYYSNNSNAFWICIDDVWDDSDIWDKVSDMVAKIDYNFYYPFYKYDIFNGKLYEIISKVANSDPGKVKYIGLTKINYQFNYFNEIIYRQDNFINHMLKDKDEDYSASLFGKKDILLDSAKLILDNSYPDTTLYYGENISNDDYLITDTSIDHYEEINKELIDFNNKLKAVPNIPPESIWDAKNKELLKTSLWTQMIVGGITEERKTQLLLEISGVTSITGIESTPNVPSSPSIDVSKLILPETTVTNLTTNTGTKVNTYTFSQKNGTVTTIDMNPTITELTTKVESSVNNITNSVIPQLKTEVTDTIQNKVKEATDNINNNLTTNISNIVNNKIIEAKTEIVNETKSDIKQEIASKGDKYKLEYKNGENGKDDTLTFVKNVYDTSINKYKADDITTIDLPYIKKSNLEMQLNTPNKKVIVIDKDGSSSPAINSKSEYAANINTVDVMLTYKDQNTGTLKLAIPNNKEKPTDLFDEFYIGRQLLGTINFSYTTFWSSNKILKVLAKKLSIFKTEVVEDVKKDLPKPQRVPNYTLGSTLDENNSNLLHVNLMKDNTVWDTINISHIPNLNINISNTKLNDSQKAQSKDKISSIFGSSDTTESIRNSWFGVDSPQYPQMLKDLYRGNTLYNHYIHEPNKNLTDNSKDDDSKTYLDLGDNIKLKFNDTNRYVPFEIINKSYKNYYNENNIGPLRVYSNEYIDTIFKAVTGSIKHLATAVERVQYLGVLPRPEIRLDSDLQYKKSNNEDVTKVDFEQIKGVDIPVTSTTKSSIIKGKSYYILSNVNHRSSGNDKASSELLIPLEFSDRFYMRGGHYNTTVGKDIYSTDGCLEYTRSDDLLDMNSIDRSDYWSEFIDKVATQHMIDTSIQIALKNYTPTDKDPMTTEKLDKQINSVVTLQTNNLISDIKVEPDTAQNNIYTTSYKVKLTQKDGVAKDVKLPQRGVVTRVGVIFDNTDTIKYNKPKADI